MKWLSTNRSVNAAFVLGVISVAAVFLISVRHSRRVKDTTEQVEHTQHIRVHIQKLIVNVLDIQTSVRDYVITGDDQFLEQFRKKEEDIPGSLGDLKEHLADDTGMAKWFDSLQFYIARRLEISNEMVSLRQQDKTDAAGAIVASGGGKYYTGRIRHIGDELERMENAVLGERKRSNDASISKLDNILYSVLVAVALLSALFFIRVRKGLKQHKASEEKFRALMEAAPDATVIVDESGVIRMINRQTERLFGYRKEEMIGQPVEMLMPQSFRNEHEKQRQHFNRAGKAKSVREGRELSASRKDGSVFLAEISLAPIHTGGEKYVSASVRDITMQRTLREQVSYLASIVEQSSEAIISRGLDKRLISWNQGAEKLMGYTREEAMGKTAGELGMTRFTAEEKAEMENEVMEKGTWHAEKIYYHKNGSSFIGDVTASALKNEAGEITSMAFIIKDISSRKQLEAQLKRSNEELERKVKERTEEISKAEKKYRHLFENNPMPLFVIDRQTFRFLDVNGMATQNYGYSREEFLSMTATDIRTDEEKERFIKFDRPSPLEGEEANKGIWKHRKKNGTIIQVEIIAHHISFGGVPARLILANDITEKKQAEDKLAASEKRFRALTENNYDIITLVDQSFNVIYRSPSATRVTGWTNKEMAGVNATKHIHPDDLERATGTVKELLANPGKPIYCQFRNLHRQGHYVWIEGVVINWLQDEHVKAVVLNFRDVTERIKSEEKLIAGEKRYRDTLDNMMEGVQILDFGWRYIYVNDAAAKQAKLPKEDLLGCTLMEKFPGIDQTALYKTFQRCFTERVSIQMENEFTYPDGSAALYELSFQAVPEGVFVLSVDITEKVRATKTLKEERDKFSSVAATSPGLIYSFRMKPDGTFSFPYASNSIIDIFGYTAESVSDNLELIFNSSHQADKDMVLKSIAISARDLSPWQLEFRYMHPLKGMLWLEGNSIPVRESDGSTIWHGIIMDITELKRTGEKLNEQTAQLQTLSDNLPGVMIYQLVGETDGSKKFTYLSNEVTRLTGKTPEDVISDPSILYDLVIERDRSKISEAEKESFLHMTVFNVEVRCFSVKDGLRWLNIVSTPRKLSDGRVVWDGFLVDITDRKKMEKRMKYLNAELEQQVMFRTAQLKKINEELEAFTYSVSHDLRAPLRGIIGFSAILEEEYASQLDDEARRITGIIKSNTLKMGNLIDDLLAFSRMGRHDIDKVVFDTNEVVKNVIDNMEKKGDGASIEWVIHSLQTSYGDINTIRQVWINLISNAVKYTGKTTNPKIEIGSYVKQDEIVFFIKDNGVGFDQKYSNKLFKVFQRLHASNDFEGTGVGLAIVDKIVSKHGGCVWAEGETGKGATFYFSQPAEQPVLPAADTINF